MKKLFSVSLIVAILTLGVSCNGSAEKAEAPVADSTAVDTAAAVVTPTVCADSTKCDTIK